MQNCNTHPDVMINSPLQADKFPFYMFNDRIHAVSREATRQ